MPSSSGKTIETKNLVVAGNFNMTNVDELFQQLINLGQAPKEKTDTITILEKIGTSLMRKTIDFITNTKIKA